MEARNMLYWEFQQRMEGKRHQEERDWHKIRVLAALLLSPHSKKEIKPESLIRLDGEESQQMSKEDIQKDVEMKMKAYRKAKAG